MSRPSVLVVVLTHGEGGIRTHETPEGPTDFRDRLLQPLGHLSLTTRIIDATASSGQVLI